MPDSIDDTTAAPVTSSMTVATIPPWTLPIGGTYTAVGEIVRMGRAMAIADARILNEEGKVLARGTCIFQIPRPK